MKIVVVAIISFLVLTSCTSRKAPAPIADISDAGLSYLPSYRNTLSDDTYEVKQGETLYSIAWRSGQDFRYLAQINQIDKPYNIYPGQKLIINPKTVISKVEPPKPVIVGVVDSLEKNNKKPIANEKSVEYGKKQQDHRDTQKANKDPFPSKIRKWRYPSKGKIIETYSSRVNGNKGLDFGGKEGDSIIAAADGKVVYAGSALRGYGNLIIVKHNNDYLSAYAHNRSLKVKEQDWVKAGQVIAEMGKSGSDRVRLHFEIRFRGRSVNPLKYLPKR